MTRSYEQAVAKYYRVFGKCTVYQNSDPGQQKGKHGYRGTPGRTPGIPDMFVFHEPSGDGWWHEVKTGSGRLSKAQREFKRLSELCGIPVIVGDSKAAKEQLISLGIANETNGVMQYVWDMVGATCG